MLASSGSVARTDATDRQLAAAFRGRSSASDPSGLECGLVDAIAVLRTIPASHALIGGLAVAVHAAAPRATPNVDFAVRSDVDKDVVIAAFERAGFTLTARFEHSLNFLHSLGDSVQIAMDAGFDGAIDRAELLRIGGTEVRIARREDLIALKERAAADPRRRRSKALRDRADIELLRGDRSGPDEGW
jgi:hypothetical protein